MAFPFMLLAAQAAGIGLNLYQTSRARRMEKLGYEIDRDALRLQQAQMDLRMDQEGAQTAEQSLFDIRQLQEVMSSQRAMFAARGQMAGQGSAGTIQEGSIGAYQEDVRSKGLSNQFRKSYLRSQKSVLESTMRAQRIGQYGVQAQRGNQLMMKGINMFSANALFNTDAFALSKK